MNEKTFSKFNGYVVKDSQARSDIKTINNEIATINTNIGSTNKNVETNKNNIDANAKAITTLNNNIGVINSTIDTLDSSVRSITDDNEAISNRMDEINESFENLGDVANIAGELVDRIDANTTKIAENTSKIAENTAKIEEVESSLDNLDITYVDNLTSTDTDKGLSANQGKVLKDFIDTNISNLTDAIGEIIEEGKNDAGEWIKFSNGRMIILQTKFFDSVNMNISIGNLFRANIGAYPNYPVTFKEPPLVFLQVVNLFNCILPTQEGIPSTTNPFNYNGEPTNVGIMAPVKNTYSSVYCYCLSIGRWK